jgi:hypothetical protein
MVSTVTTTIYTLLTTSALAGSFALVGILVLITLIIQKELIAASGNRRRLKLGKLLNIGILPLLFAFILIVLFKVIESLN